MARLIEPGIQPGASSWVVRNSLTASAYLYCSMWPRPRKWASMTFSSASGGILFSSDTGEGAGAEGPEVVGSDGVGGLAVSSGCVPQAEAASTPAAVIKAS